MHYYVSLFLFNVLITYVHSDDVASPYPDLTTACALPNNNICATQQWGCIGM